MGVEKYIEVPVERYVDVEIPVEKIVEKPFYCDLICEKEIEKIVQIDTHNEKLRAEFKEVQYKIESYNHENHNLQKNVMITLLELDHTKMNVTSKRNTRKNIM